MLFCCPSLRKRVSSKSSSKSACSLRMRGEWKFLGCRRKASTIGEFGKLSIPDGEPSEPPVPTFPLAFRLASPFCGRLASPFGKVDFPSPPITPAFSSQPLSALLLPCLKPRMMSPSFSFIGLRTKSTMRHVQVAEHVQNDTVYLSNVQYDSIYIDRSSDTDRTRDTITVTRTLTEYRYKLLRDTVRIVQRDSIPYEVRITEMKEVRKPPNIFDDLCYLSFGILIGIIGWKLYGLFRIL